MDVSSVYVKMCDCPEVQGKWKIGIDAMAHPVTDPHNYVQIILKPHPKHKTQQACITIWLPRQDQIQDMLPESSCKCSCCLIAHLNKFIKENIDGMADVDVDSMEQYWLSFYMSENHQKIWDGEKWVKSAKE